MTLEQVFAAEGDRITPLSRYILAHRDGGHDLSRRHREAAQSQHRSCPLYRIASRCLLPSHAYPTRPRRQMARSEDNVMAAFSLN